MFEKLDCDWLHLKPTITSLLNNCFMEIIFNFLHRFPPWPTIFTRPNITHFEEKNSRPDF